MQRSDFLTAIIVCTLLLAVKITRGEKSASAEFVHRKLSHDEIQDARKVAFIVRYEPVLGTRINDPQFAKVDMPWYVPVSFTDTRYDAIGSLMIFPAVKKSPGKFSVQPPNRCTAFYVSADILATAAHCFLLANVTAKSNHVITFRQQFDSRTKYTKELAEKFERVVVEWIFPTKYAKKQDPMGTWCEEDGYDYAFMRTDRPSNDINAFYPLKSPEDFLFSLFSPRYTPIEIVGYPAEYSEFIEPAKVSCVLHKVTDGHISSDPGVDKYTRRHQTELFKAVKGNQLFCLGDEGNMQAGGSGGPWLLGNGALSSKDRKSGNGKARWALGIQSWAIQRRPARDKKELEKEQELCKVSVTAWLKPTVLDIYNAIVATPKEKSFLDGIAKVCDKGHR